MQWDVILVLAGVGGFVGFRAYVQGNEARRMQPAEDAPANSDPSAAEKAADEALALDLKDAEAAALLVLLVVDTNNADSLKTTRDQTTAIVPDSVPALLAQAA